MVAFLVSVFSLWCAASPAPAAIDLSAQAVPGDSKALASSPAPLTDEQIRTLLLAAQQAQRGRYVTSSLLGDVPATLKRVDEFLMDENDGRIRFMRYTLTDPHTQKSTINLIEFTRQPATLCAGGTRTVRGTLAINFSHWDGKWQRAYGSVAMTTWLEPLTDALAAPVGELQDAGFRTTSAGRLRGFSWRGFANGNGVLTVWIDPRSLLMIRAGALITMEGKTIDLETGYNYPAPKPIGRPDGVTVPNCI